MPYKIISDRIETIVLVGCGGTGSLVASGLCRLLRGSDIGLLFVDMDRVETHNLYRQDFFKGDVGRFKSQVLAERLSCQYGRTIGYSVLPYEKDMFDEDWGAGMRSKKMRLTIVGCVDSASARRSIADSIGGGLASKWWIDAGNGFASGQVLLGNAKDKEALQEGFNKADRTVVRLPMPSLQLPALLIPPVKPVRPRDCAEEVEDNEQSPTINGAMATLVLDFMYKLLRGTLTSMGAYLDMESGSLTYVPATPETVARMCSVKVSTLFANQCALGARYHV